MTAVVRTLHFPGRDTYHHQVWCPGCEDMHAWQTAAGPNPQGPVWDYNGDADRPTVSPSLRVTGGPHDTVCHSFIRDGVWEYLSDSTHHLAGQTVPMVPYPDA